MKFFKKGLAIAMLAVFAVSTAVTTVTLNTTVAYASKSKKNSNESKIKTVINKNGVLTYYNGEGELYLNENVSALAVDSLYDAKVTSFKVSSSNPYLKSVNGVLYTRDGSMLVRYPSYKYDSNFTVPSTVKTICYSAFSDAKVKNVKIPEGVATIGKYAFRGCTSLTQVNIPSSTKTIREGTFEGCSSLSSIKLPNGLTSIRREAFSYCGKLNDIEIPDTVENIGNNAFQGCSSLTKINLPEKIEKIKSGLFYGCKSLSEVNLGKNVSSIGSYAFSGCSSLANIDLPDNLDKIENGAFYYCENLEDMILPGGLSWVGDYSFYKCLELTKIDIPNSVEYVGSYAFCGDENLESFVWSDSAREIHSGTFKECVGLREITIPQGVKTIERQAFFGCESASKVTIPSSVTEIASDALGRCGSEYIVDEENAVYASLDGVLYNENYDCLIRFPYSKSGDYEAPSGVTKISSNAFRGCCNIDTITIPEGVRLFNAGSIKDSSVKCLNLPSTLKKIKYAYYRGLYVEKLEEINISDSKKFVSEDGILYNKDKTEICIYPTAKTGKVSLPSTLKNIDAIPYSNAASYFDIDEDENSIFKSDDGVITNKTVTKVINFPGNMKKYVMADSIRDVSIIYNNKFALKNFVAYGASKDNNKYTVSGGVLYSKKNGKLLDYPACKKGSFKLGDDVDKINMYAFSYTKNLTELRFNDSIQSMSISFTESGVEKIVIPEGQMRNFYAWGLDNLKEIECPSSLISLELGGYGENLVVHGWSNTKVEQFALDNNLAFVSEGYVPAAVLNVKIVGYANARYAILSWDTDKNVTGYEITVNDRTKIIDNNKTNSMKIYVGGDGYVTAYVRAYKEQNGKRVFGTSKKVEYSNY